MRAGRLVLISDYFGAGGAATGGAGIASLDSFETLSAMGVRVQLISGYFAPEGASGPRVQRLGGRDLRTQGFGAAFQAVYNPTSRAQIAPLLADLDPQTTVVVLHQWTRWLSPSVLELLSRYKLLVCMHDYFWCCPNGAYYDFGRAEPCDLKPMGARCVTSACDRSSYAHKLARVARQAAKTWLTRAPSPDRALLHLSEASRRLIAPLTPGETHRILHNPLSAAVLAAPDRPAAPLYDVGYFGRLEPEKGVADLCGAVADGRLKGLFVGDGALQPVLRQQLGAEAVVDWASPKDALALMRRCKVVALPSRWPETWGLVVAEAMAQGCRVLVSNRAGASELVDRFGGGRVFDPGEPGALAASLASLLTAEPTGRSPARAVRQALAPEQHGQRMLDIVEELWGLQMRPRTSRPTAAAELTT